MAVGLHVAVNFHRRAGAVGVEGVGAGLVIRAAPQVLARLQALGPG